MSLDEHYLFSEPFPQHMGSGDQAIAAQEVASGLSVVIHLLAGGNAPGNQEQLQIARDLPPASVRFLREIGEHRGTPYVVTEPLPDKLPFRAWLGQITGTPMLAPPADPKPLVGSPPDVNKFRRQVWKVPAVPPAVDQAKPGEFTQLFRAPDASVPPPAPVNPAPVNPTPAAAGPGDFTQMLQAQASSQPQPTAVTDNPTASFPVATAAPTGPISSPRAASEFTQLMQAAPRETVLVPVAPHPVTLASPVPGSPVAVPVEPAADDEFARMLQSPPASPAAAAPAPDVTKPSEYEPTRLFSAPANPAPQPLRTPQELDFGSAATPSTPARSKSPLTSAEPGEFTRMLQSPMAPAPKAPLFSPATEPEVERTPGGFTQLFESPFGSSPPGAPPATPVSSFPASHKPPTLPAPSYPATPAARDRNEFDRLFNEPNAPPVRGDSTKVFSAPQAAAPPQQQGPSEYTLMFKPPPQTAAAAPSAPAPKAAQPAAPAPAANVAGKYMTLIYVLGALLVVALAVVIYLLMRH